MHRIVCRASLVDAADNGNTTTEAFSGNRANITPMSRADFLRRRANVFSLLLTLRIALSPREASILP